MHRTAHLSAVLLAAGLAASARADVHSWAAGNGLWSTPTNWAPNGVPGSGDTVQIGNLPGVQNFNVFLGASTGYGDLLLSSGMTLDMNGHELVSFGDAWITGAGTRLIVRPHAGINIHDFQGVLHLGVGATLDLRDDAPVRIFDDFQSAGTITGRGHIQLESDTPFPNDGIIRPGGNGGLTLDQAAVGYPIDLDGTSGNGQLVFDTPFSVLTVMATGLADTFSGTITMAPGALLTMEVGPEWAADSGGDIIITGTNNPAAASQINGSDLALSAAVHVGAGQAHLRFLDPVGVLAAANIDLDAAAWLEFAGDTTVSGGAFSVGEDAKLEFDGPTTLEGGAFTTHSADTADGFVAFNGATTWNGTVVVNGAARQNGDASVSGPTTITADLLDMSGASGSTSWAINASLVVNATSIRPGPVNNFTGDMTIGGGFLGRLTLNTPWTMAGDMHLIGTNPLYSTRLAGSPATLSGEISINNAHSEITADFTALPGATLTFDAPGSHLRLRGQSAIRENTVFTGQGMLVNGINGRLTLYNAATLGEVGLVNQGELLLRRSPSADQPASAAVDRFTNEGTFRARIGGLVQGTGHDYLRATTGTATLGGQLRVELINLATFTPTPGDQFTILRATGGLVGTFANDPVTNVGGARYDWSILYTATDVILRLDSISCYANCDLSTTPPVLNVADFACFMNAFAAGDPYANCDGSTTAPVLNVQDFACFLNIFAAGCS